MLKRSLFVIPILAILTTCGPADISESAGGITSAIVGGKAEYGYPAVGVLQFSNALCTGTLISPKIVLTAAHCVAVGHSGYFRMGYNPLYGQDDESRRFSYAVANPAYDKSAWVPELGYGGMTAHDVAVVILDKGIKDVTPIKYRTKPLYSSMKKDPVLFVGYGERTPGNNNSVGQKYSVKGSLDVITSQGFMNYVADRYHPQNTCEGDSGGPALYTDPQDGLEVVGTVSLGDQYCAQFGYNMRVDANAEWIADMVYKYDSSVNGVCGDGNCGANESHKTCPNDCAVVTPVCGNGKCESDIGENCQNCADDCGKCKPVCGNGACETAIGENCQNCTKDCGACLPVCGNGKCEHGETCKTCSRDCGKCLPVCGNGTCESGETCKSCAKDCGACLPVCGDGTCESGETCQTCAKDCGACLPVCGNGTCESGETCQTCAKDCGECKTVCGNGKCESGETCQTCASDCGNCKAVCGNKICESGESCLSCPGDCGVCKAVCGDKKCEKGENCQTCESDCGKCLPVCGNGNCETGETCSTCVKDCGKCVAPPKDSPSGGCSALGRSTGFNGIGLLLMLVMGGLVFLRKKRVGIR